MTYVDANVFIFAAVDPGELGQAARQILAQIIRGKLPATTSALTYDEVVWGIRKAFDKEKSYLAGELFLQLPHLLIQEANRKVVMEAHHLMKHHNLKPRDAIHLATMSVTNEKHIISEDPDFDHLLGIVRIPLLQFQ